MRTNGAHMAGKDGDRALQGIIRMLLALAMLAERASGRSLPVRWLAFWILRPAEAFAQAFVCDVAQEQFLFIADSGLLDDDGFTQIMSLALRFRALAAALSLLLAQPKRSAVQARRSVGGTRLVVRHLTERSTVGLPGSRAPPLPVRQGGSKHPNAKAAAWGALARLETTEFPPSIRSTTVCRGRVENRTAIAD